MVNARTSHTPDGVETTFAIGFLYSAVTHIVVSIEGTESEYLNDFTINADGTDVVFNSAPAAGGTNTLVITRRTTHPEPLVTFQRSAPITAAQLDAAVRQVLYYIEEIEDSI